MDEQQLESLKREIDRRYEEHRAGASGKRRLRRIFRLFLLGSAVLFLILALIFFINFLRLNQELVEVQIGQRLLPWALGGTSQFSFARRSGNLLSKPVLEEVVIRNPHFPKGGVLLFIGRAEFSYSLVDIFWGRATLNSVALRDVVLTLSRNDQGRAIWDFRDAAPKPAIPSTRTNAAAADGSEAFAGSTLRKVVIENLSVQVPRPRDFFPDQGIARLLRLPPGNIDVPGVDVIVEQHQASAEVGSDGEMTVDHTLRVHSRVSGEGPSPLMFALLSRNVRSGNWSCSLQLLGQRLAIGMENRATGEKRVTILDERNRDRFSLRFNMNPDEYGRHSVFRALNGAIILPDLRRLVERLHLNLDLAGSVKIRMSSDDTAGPADAEALIEVSDLRLKFPEVVDIEHGMVACALQKREGAVTRLDGFWNGIRVEQSGVFHLGPSGDVNASFTARIATETLNWRAGLSHPGPSERRLEAALDRAAGMLRVAVRQEVGPAAPRWKNGDVHILVRPDFPIADVLPERLVPAAIRETWASYTKRLGVLGPLEISGAVTDESRLGESQIHIALDGATIRDPVRLERRLSLQGNITLAQRRLELQGVGFRFDRLSVAASGTVELDESGRRWRNGLIEIGADLSGNSNWTIDAESVRRLLPRGIDPGFDLLTLRGSQLMRMSFGPSQPKPELAIDADHLLISRGKRVLKFAPLHVQATTPDALFYENKRPPVVQASLSAEVFGVGLQATLSADLARHEFQSLGVRLRSRDCGEVVRQLREVPAVAELFGRRQMDVSGGFSAVVAGEGPMAWPVVRGEFTFPDLLLTWPGHRVELPCTFTLESPTAGAYRGEIRTKSVRGERHGVTFILDLLKAVWRYERSVKAAEHTFTLGLNASLYDTQLRGELEMQPRLQRVRQVRVAFAADNMQKLSRELGRAGGFALPFDMSGGLQGEWTASGTISQLTSRASCKLAGLQVRIPLRRSRGQPAMLDLRELGGTLDLVQRSPTRFDAVISHGTAAWLKAPLALDGQAAVERLSDGRWMPTVERLNVKLSQLPVHELQRVWGGELAGMPELPPLTNATGTVSATIALKGSRNRYLGEGRVGLEDVGFTWPGTSLPMKKGTGSLVLARKLASEPLALTIEGVTAEFGRARVSISRGSLLDPFGACRLDLEGKAQQVFPTDVLALFAGLRVPSVSFPIEGGYAGSVHLSGPLQKPAIRVRVSGSEKTEIIYRSDQQEYRFPIGTVDLTFGYRPTDGLLQIEPGDIGVLGGRLQIASAVAELRKGRAVRFDASGGFSGIDLGSFSRDGQNLVIGLLSGRFQARQTEGGQRDLLVHLGLQNLKVLALPVDEAMMDRIGLNMLEEPEFATGTLNLYLSSDGDLAERGRLRLADGLLAGPDLRLEIEDSAFDPRQLQIDGRLMFNPQPLRRTKIGRKLGKMTKLVQDKATGIPYIDLTVQGTWDNPRLIGKVIMNRLKKRGKRNFIRSIFGGHRPHKASVQELMEWFPGWEP